MSTPNDPPHSAGASRDRLLTALFVLTAGALIYLTVGGACEERPPEVDAPPPLDAGPPPPDAAPVVDAAPPDAYVIDDDNLTLEVIQRVGLLDRPAEWVPRLFEGRDEWTHDPRSPAPTWVNGNGTRVSFKVRGGRVVGVGAEFDASSNSAEATALSQFMVGNRDAVPLRLENAQLGGPTVRTGQFEDALGRRLYYRAEMHTTGEPPFGPEVFEVARSPFPGQSMAVPPPVEALEATGPLAPVIAEGEETPAPPPPVYPSSPTPEAPPDPPGDQP